MKKLLLAGLIFCGLSAYAGMHAGDNYINVQAGLNVDRDRPLSIGLENSRLALSYGMPIESGMGNYLGFAEFGLKGPIAMALLKYGYECMRDSAFSFGGDIALSAGMSSLSMDELAVGGEPGVFAKMNGDSFSVFLRVGLLIESPFSNLRDVLMVPSADLGFQYNL